MGIALSLLGAAVLGDPAAGRVLPADRRGCLLAYVAYDGGWVDRNRLALLFWPEADETSAKRNLRQLLLRVRRLELDPPLEVTDDAVRWRVPNDVADFRRALAAADYHGAAARYGGPLLDGFAVHDIGGVDAWLEVERERLHAAFHTASMRDAAASAALGRYADAGERLHRLLGFDPMAEDVMESYVRVLYLGGRRDAALQTYERFARRLHEDLGLEPLDTTQELADSVRRGEAIEGAVVPVESTPDVPRTPLAPPRLVARDGARAAARAAATPVVVVAGEPGIGKTAFLRELLPNATWCGASEGLERLPYHPLAAMARARPALAVRLGPYREDLARLVPEVAPELTPGPLDPATAKGRLAEALARLVEATGSPLVIDDLQWADPATLDTLAYLAVRGVRVYGAYRTGEARVELLQMLQALRSRGALTEIALDALTDEAVRTLIGDLMGRASGPPIFARWLHARSGGNPMFVLESLRALFEAGVLRADAQGWHTDIDELTHDYAELDVPPAVSGVIARRLARLAAPTVRVLEAAAVMHAGFDARFLARVTGLSANAVADALVEATHAGFIERSAFRHDLLRQSLDRGLEPARRIVLHTLVAEALEGRSDPGVVAEHWWRAGELRRARLAWLEEARGMRSRGLQVAAMQVLRAAIARFPAGEDSDWLRLSLADAAREGDRADEAEGLVREVEEGGRDVPALRFAAMHARAALLLHRGRAVETQELLDAARPLASVVEDPELRLDDVMMRSRAGFELGRRAEVAELLEPVVEEMRSGRPHLRLVQFLTSLASCYDVMGRNAEALALHTEALGLARTLGARYHQVEVAINLLFCYAELGRFDDGAQIAEEALLLGDYDNVAILRNNLAANHLSAGRDEEALRHYALLAEDDKPYIRLIALARGAEAHARLGHAAQVGPLLDAALASLQLTDYPVAQGAVAVAVLQHGDDDQVERLTQLLPDLRPEQLPSYLGAELEAARTSRRKVTVT